MRNVIVILFAVLLLFGCASKEAVNETAVIPLANITNNPIPQINESNTTLEVPENITNLTASYNLTTELVNVTEVGNKTQTEKDANGLKFGKYILTLDDVTVVGSSECAVIQIYAVSTMESIHKDLVCKGKDYYWTAPDKHKYRFLITEIAAGYSNNAIWAKVFVYG